MAHRVVQIISKALRNILSPKRGGRHRPRPETVQRLLLINRLPIGQAVATTPILSNVRIGLPGAEITLMVQRPLEELFGSDPRIDALVVKGKRGLTCLRGHWARGFDMAVILDPSFRSAWLARRAGARWIAGYDSRASGVFLDARLRPPEYWERPLREYFGQVLPIHQTDAWLQLIPLIGLSLEERAPYIALSDADRFWAEERIAGMPGTGPLIAFHPGGNASCRWPLPYWGRLATELFRTKQARLVVTGGPQDMALGQKLAATTSAPMLCLSGEATLGQTAAVFSRMDGVVSGDSCAPHIAAAVGTSCVTLFGAGDPDIRRPYGKWHISLRTEMSLPCLGCKRDTCALERHECMLGIPVEKVLQAILKLPSREPVCQA